MGLRPLQDRILLRRTEAEDTTPAGIVIPSIAQEKSQWYIVVATGPGRASEDGRVFTEVMVKKGDRVLLGKYAGTEVKIEGVDHVIVREEDILGVESTDD